MSLNKTSRNRRNYGGGCATGCRKAEWLGPICIKTVLIAPLQCECTNPSNGAPTAGTHRLKHCFIG